MIKLKNTAYSIARLPRRLRDRVRLLSGREATNRLEAEATKLSHIDSRFDQVLERLDIVLGDLHLRLPQIPISYPPTGAVDLRGISELQAALDSASYMNENMAGASFFTDRNEFLKYCVAESGDQPVFMEFGVFSGSSINVIADAAPANSRIFGFDSFEGLPHRWRPGFEAGHFQVSTLPSVRPNVQLIKGWFEDTLPLFVENMSSKIGFLHVDCDLYSSTSTIFKILTPYFADEVVVVFDEYFNYPGWRQHEFKAFSEFIDYSNYTYNYIACVPVHQQVAIRMRRNQGSSDLR